MNGTQDRGAPGWWKGGGVPDEGRTSSVLGPALGPWRKANPSGAGGDSASALHPDVIHSLIGRPVCPGEIVCRSRTGSRPEELDAVHGTPVLDIKPWFHEFGPRGTVRQAAWSSEMLTEYFATPPHDS